LLHGNETVACYPAGNVSDQNQNTYFENTVLFLINMKIIS